MPAGIIFFGGDDNGRRNGDVADAAADVRRPLCFWMVVLPWMKLLSSASSALWRSGYSSGGRLSGSCRIKVSRM